MQRKKKIYQWIALLGSASLILVLGCTIQYKFNQSSIDYTKVKTVSISYFPNHAQIVNPTLSNDMVDALTQKLLQQTKLQLVPSDGDLQFDGEITGYTLTPQGIRGNAQASQTRLTMTIKVRFTNKSDEALNFDSSFSAYADYDSSADFSSVESSLTDLLVKQLSEDIFNKALANW